MIMNYTAMPRFQASLEVDRYITWPGQACAYKVGEMTLQKWRSEAEERIGNYYNFTIGWRLHRRSKFLRGMYKRNDIPNSPIGAC